nr:uncharacterized protein LOC117849443 [Setaria viridis]
MGTQGPGVAASGGSLLDFFGRKSKYSRMDYVLPQELEDGGGIRIRGGGSSSSRYVFACSVFASLNHVLLGYELRCVSVSRYWCSMSFLSICSAVSVAGAFAAISAVSVVFVHKLVPETKGKDAGADRVAVRWWWCRAGRGGLVVEMELAGSEVFSPGNINIKYYAENGLMKNLWILNSM